MFNLLLSCIISVLFANCNAEILSYPNLINVSSNNSSRRLIETEVCATPGEYDRVCVPAKPEGCPCTKFAPEEIEPIVNLHNKWRNIAAKGDKNCNGGKCPSASNMNSVFWDSGLATIANYWAHQCQTNKLLGTHHGKLVPGEQKIMYGSQCDAGNCKASGYITPDRRGRDAIGENIHKGIFMPGRHGHEMTFDKILGGVDRWYHESQDYVWGMDIMSAPMSAPVGHFTQGVWAQTRYIGCGYALCPHTYKHPFPGTVYEKYPWINFVCKYYPSGNVGKDTPPYVKGSPCDNCDHDRDGGCVVPIGSAGRIRSAAEGNFLCGGQQCSSCAFQFNQQTCEQTLATCDGTTLTPEIAESRSSTPPRRRPPVKKGALPLSATSSAEKKSRRPRPPVTKGALPKLSPRVKEKHFTGAKTKLTASAESKPRHKVRSPLPDIDFAPDCIKINNVKQKTGSPLWTGDLNGVWHQTGKHNGKPYYQPVSKFPKFVYLVYVGETYGYAILFGNSVMDAVKRGDEPPVYCTDCKRGVIECAITKWKGALKKEFSRAYVSACTTTLERARRKGRAKPRRKRRAKARTMESNRLQLIDRMWNNVYDSYDVKPVDYDVYDKFYELYRKAYLEGYWEALQA